MVRLSSMLRFQKREPKPSWFLSWLPKNVDNWRSRLAFTYAMTVWTMIGFVTYMHFRTKDEKTAPSTDEDPFLHPEGASERIKEFSLSLTPEHNDNTPLSTRLRQFFTSSNKTSDSHPAED